MRFLLNDLSIHGQFRTPAEFVEAVQTLMKIRALAKQSDVEVFCSELIVRTVVMPDLPMMKAVNSLELNERRAWVSWITNLGTYWQSARQHSDKEWLTTDGDVIATDHAVGEAAFCKSSGLSYSEIVSVAPSDWLRNPIEVAWTRDEEAEHGITLVNHWTEDTVKSVLAEAPTVPKSWEQFAVSIFGSFDNITISDDAFTPLRGYPFQPSVADDIVQRLGVLNEMSGAIDQEGNRTAAFTRMHETYFKGHDPYFTDESDGNLAKYGTDLVFPAPNDPAKNVACAWHGKVNSRGSFPPVRIHHTWPPKQKGDIHVAYIGPKITTR